MPSSNSKKELMTNAFMIQFAFGIGCAIALIIILKGYFYSATIVIMPFVVSTITLLASFTGVLFLFYGCVH